MTITEGKGATGETAGTSGIQDGHKERLLREKAYFESLVESAMEGIIIADKAGRVLRANDEFQRIFGYAAEEIFGRALDELIVPQDQMEAAVSITQRVIRGEKAAFEK